jgi:hypothetical protein
MQNFTRLKSPLFSCHLPRRASSCRGSNLGLGCRSRGCRAGMGTPALYKGSPPLPFINQVPTCYLCLRAPTVLQRTFNDSQQRQSAVVQAQPACRRPVPFVSATRMANQPVYQVDYSMFGECPRSADLAGYLLSRRAAEQLLDSAYHPIPDNLRKISLHCCVIRRCA